jgi:hypothetical protein
MKLRHTLLAVALAAAASAQAAPVPYAGTLVSGIPEQGTAGGFSWFLDDGAAVGYWQFQAGAGEQVTLAVDRLSANLDPALSLYEGVTTADTSSFSSTSNWGGMTYIGSLDDEHPAFLQPGPGGDPYGTFTIASSGWYTVAVGGSLSTDAGVYPYRLTMTVAAVPEPGTWVLLAGGLGLIAFMRRRRA